MKLIGEGRTADVYELDAGRVLRRYRGGESAMGEATLMTYVRGRGFPTPEIFDADGADLVMERLHGPTMMEDLSRRPWRLPRYGKLLASLHNHLHEIAAPPWLSPARIPATRTADNRVLHLDLHPLNVVLTPSGPSVIDWCNAGAGEPAYDVAMSHVLMTTGEAPGLTALLGRKALIWAYLRNSRADARPRIADAARARVEDPNTTPAEIERLHGMIAAHGLQSQ